MDVWTLRSSPIYNHYEQIMSHVLCIVFTHIDLLLFETVLHNKKISIKGKWMIKI